MKCHSWNNEKNEILKNERGVSFEDVIYYLEHGNLLAIVKNPNNDKYHDQKIYIVNIEDYAYLVPFVETEDEIFMKTIIPSRKATKKYLEG
ncbi:MAG TPA: BrnT family toxin [Spirochaetota bacterium]|mgnify:CR=1 FL=1|nr:BrnT family toxin [Spirochaetota bacterium]HPQ54137.1 BrnT family toxin [Spirochaetota bacterium]